MSRRNVARYGIYECVCHISSWYNWLEECVFACMRAFMCVCVCKVGEGCQTVLYSKGQGSLCESISSWEKKYNKCDFNFRAARVCFWVVLFFIVFCSGLTCCFQREHNSVFGRVCLSGVARRGRQSVSIHPISEQLQHKYEYDFERTVML